MTQAERTVTQLLRAWGDGDQAAVDALVPVVEGELRRLARIHMKRERREHTLQPTALVNELFLRLVDAQDIRWQDRARFFGISAGLMRRVLVDHAGRADIKSVAVARSAAHWDGHDIANAVNHVDLIAVDRGLDGLAAVDERKCRVVEMRFFTGLSVRADEIGGGDRTPWSTHNYASNPVSHEKSSVGLDAVTSADASARRC